MDQPNAIDYLKPDELLERIKEIEASSEIIKKGDSPFFKTPDAIMGRVMQNADEKNYTLNHLKEHTLRNINCMRKHNRKSLSLD